MNSEMNKKILIVDDEEHIREILTDLLQPLGFDVTTRSNGKEALQILADESFHTVICDIMMPQMQGLDCLAMARVSGVETPWILVTGFGDEEKMLEAIRIGATDFIAKPFDSDNVVETVQRTVEIGERQHRINRMIRDGLVDTEKGGKIVQDRKMINLLRAVNNRKKTAIQF